MRVVKIVATDERGIEHTYVTPSKRRVLKPDRVVFAHAVDGKVLVRLHSRATWWVINVSGGVCTYCAGTGYLQREHRVKVSARQAAIVAFRFLLAGGRIVYGLSQGNHFYNRLDRLVAATELTKKGSA